MPAWCKNVLILLAIVLSVAGCAYGPKSTPLSTQAQVPTPPARDNSAPSTSTSTVPTPPQQVATPRATKHPRRSTFEFYSDHVADRYMIYLSLPEGYDPQHPRGYSTIYLLDGDWYFDDSSWRIGDGGVEGIVTSLTRGGQIPKSIVVGIGYVDKNQRGRDFLWQPERFYAFLTEELIPFIDAEYRTKAGSGRTLIGHSDGGYFTLYAFCQYEHGTNPFGRFIAVSGDFTKNDWFILREEGKLNRQIGDGGVIEGSLYMAVGDQEETRFVTSNQDLARRLESRGYQDLRFRSKTYRSEDHASVVTPAIWSGLLWVFGD